MNSEMRELVERCASLQRRLDAALALADAAAGPCAYWDPEDEEMCPPDCQPYCDCNWGYVYHSTLRAALCGAP